MAQTLVNEGRLRALFIGLSTVFNDALKAAPQDYQTTCMEVTSEGRGMDYAWLTRFPRMREWVGDKQVKNLELQTYYVANKNYEATIGVNRDDIEDDRLGIYQIQAQMMGQSASELYWNISNDLKVNAFAQLGMDGVPFYYDEHVLTDASGTERTYSNLGNAALSSATTTAAAASLGAGRIALMKMCDYEGQPLGLTPTVLEVPPALEATARILATSEFLGDRYPNPYNGTVKVMVNAGLRSDTAWMLHATSLPIKPFVIQKRKPPQFVAQTGIDNDNVFNRREFRYGIEARCAAAYGFWQLSYGYPGS